ncbi:hypothetical protein HYH02_008843 [Chlamydomonas schloesseri]|uniref:acylaminoacyl-peptidase n=1 Tax=Chlamydomonas schloesseri TaxID=2026947 RepID=A0A835WCQ2_9CHLO|nr:hypothetical protein HYH02_008843 [Chlamydomonas schloesseri]|eukprot:KAG2444971.1 hypothetical protein HYH02_008843 [Chlamydomonas schloesseri]
MTASVSTSTPPVTAASATGSTPKTGNVATAGLTASAPLPELPAGVEAEAALLAAFSEAPTVSKAVVRAAAAGGVALTATLQQRNLPGNSQRRYNVTALLPPTGLGPAVAGLPQELNADVQLVSVSPSGSQQLVVAKGPNDATSVLLQLWRGARLAFELAVPKALHGPLVNDGYFASGAAWSADESAVVYTAETPVPERTPAWCGPDPLKDAAGPRSWRGVGAANEDWGELNTGKRPPAPFVLDLVRREVLKVPGLPEEHSIGQPTWCPPTSISTSTTTSTSAKLSPGTEGVAAKSSSVSAATTCSSTGGGPTGLVVVAWPHAAPPSFPRLAAATSAPRKLGVVFCYNRSAHMYHVRVSRAADGSLQFGSSPATRLAPDLESCLSPTFSPAGDALVFVSHSEAVSTGTHGATASLYRLDWSPQTGGVVSSGSNEGLRLLVDVVQRPESAKAFPGLYTANIPDDGFVGPRTLLLNTQWGAVNSIVAVDTEQAGSAAKAPVPLTPVDASAPGAASWSLLGVSGGLAVASRAAPDSPTDIYVAQLPADPTVLTAAGSGPLEWRPLELGAPGLAGAAPGCRAELPPAVQEALEGLEYKVLSVTPRVGDNRDPFDCLLWMPRNRSGPLPAVVAPHGGPHTAVALGWYPAYAYLVALGYAVIVPNYRGSTGYGQAALASLPGAIGRNDVDDCMACVDAVVAEGLVDKSRVSVVGGSHGGFLTAHLLGQHPGAFRSGVMRNPVTNISAMIAASDIPDWCYVEALGSEEGRRRCAPVPSPADLAAMYAASPVQYVDAVKAPVFVMLGAKDRRVPPPDGLQYLSALRGRDVAVHGAPPESRLIVFPEDSHGLDKPQTEYEQWVNVAYWLKRFSSA